MNLDTEPTPYQQLQSIVEHLRSEFVFDRTVETKTEKPIEEFLRTRRGGDHLFATTAAIMAREIGLESRLVTGFYVRPTAFDITAGHASVLPDDVHVWVEIKLDDGRWFEIEPTPGYAQPIYTPSLWLVTKRFAAAHWIHVLGIIAIAIFGWLTRLIWIESILAALWKLTWGMRPKRQLTIAMRIIETRAWLTGKRRPVGKPQRDWLESLASSNDELRIGVRQFCDAADRTIFGSATALDRASMTCLVRSLTARTFQTLGKQVIA